MISKKQREVLKKVTTLLEENNIPFQITGGLAALAYGARRPLYDIDLEVHKADVPRVQKLFREYITEDYYHLQDENFDMYLLTMVIEGVPIDVGQAENNYYSKGGCEKVRLDSHIDKAVLMDIDGLKLPVQDKEELIAYKSLMPRQADLQDIAQIS